MVSRRLVQAVVQRYKRTLFAGAASARDLRVCIERALTVFQRIQTWGSSFGSTLSEARASNEGLPPTWVWQDDLVPFFQRFEALQESLQSVEKDLRDYTFGEASLSAQATKALKLVSEPTKKARPDYAMEVFEFFGDPRAEGEENIAYKVPRLQDWFRNFERWAKVCEQGLQGLLKEMGRQA